MRVLKNDGTPWEVREEDILYYTSYQSTIYVHTEEGEFIYPTSLSDLYAANADIGYDRLDRGNVVNTTHISDYDPERKVVLFGNQSGKFAAVSEPNESRLKNLLKSKKEKDST